MHIPWKWIKEQINLPKEFSPKHLINKLNYLGLECEETFDEEQNLFINFIAASNRKDLKSWWGISREICILLGIEQPSFLKNNESSQEKENSKKISLKIKTNKFSEYNISIIENIKVKESPQSIKYWLKKNKIRSVNGIVDIANFVMLETGQPLHIFDFDKIKSNDLNQEEIITIREAASGEKFEDIYGKERVLSDGDLIACNNEKIIDLIGIIGEKSTSVTEKTKNIMIESVAFNNILIKSTIEKIKLNTKASDIFSKNLNQESSIESLKRATNLIKEIFEVPEKNIEYFFFSDSNNKEKNKEIKINHVYIEKKLGIKISKKKVIESLNQLELKFKLENNRYNINIPKHRKDISIKEDIIEEIGKILDYNTLPGVLPNLTNEFIDEKFNFKYNLKKKISNYLTSIGYQEIISYSLVEEEKLEKNLFRVIIPKSSSHVTYRDSFINSHINTIRNNLRQGANNVFIFEFGSVYFQEESKIVEKEILTLSSCGNIINSLIHSIEEKNDFYWMKGSLENILSILEIENIKYSEIENQYLEKKQSASIIFKDKKIGLFGKVNKKILEKNEIGGNDLFTMEISLNEILNESYKSRNKKYSEISYLPIVKKDISFIIDKSIDLNEISKMIKEKGDEFLLEVELFDIYENNIYQEKHSASFRLSFQGKEENLKNIEIEQTLNEIIKEIKLRFSIIER
ncbi:MAG: Phenylalanine--tRNA ligase beta subunit [Mycoplasmataceae bacterium]|nr:MAG: Phenylalanine--tRNA ligase beta subunit [Mycoplasmataceae bacterium]